MCVQHEHHPGARRRLALRIIGLLLPLILLTACGGGEVTEEIRLLGNERWKADLTLTLNAAERQGLGDDFEQGWDDLVARAAEDGVKLNWRRRQEQDGGVSYVITMRGRGWDSLNEACFDGKATITRDTAGHVRIAWNAASTTSRVRAYRLTIHGGPVASSNASSFTNNSATWQNPSRVEVQLREGGFPFTELLALAIAGAYLVALLIFGGGGLLLLARRQSFHPSAD
jgi:hypothetical protein